MTEMDCHYPGCPAKTYSSLYCSYHEAVKRSELESKVADPDLVAVLRAIKWLFLPLLYAAAWWVFWQVRL
jgi:hypothetical protein